MSRERELLRKAASFLHDTYDGVSYMESLLQEIDEVLEEPEAEPVAWMWKGNDGLVYFENSGDPDHNWTPLYTHTPRQSVQFSDDEIIRKWTGDSEAESVRPVLGRNKIINFARAVIAAYEEKQK